MAFRQTPKAFAFDKAASALSESALLLGSLLCRRLEPRAIRAHSQPQSVSAGWPFATRWLQSWKSLFIMSSTGSCEWYRRFQYAELLIVGPRLS